MSFTLRNERLRKPLRAFLLFSSITAIYIFLTFERISISLHFFRLLSVI